MKLPFWKKIVGYRYSVLHDMNFIMNNHGTKFHFHTRSRPYFKDPVSSIKKSIGNKVAVVTFGLGSALLLGLSLLGKTECQANELSVICDKKRKTLNKAIAEARELAIKIKDVTGSPGLVVAVSIDGKEVWSEGFGYSDIENRIPCSSDTVMRIASISKPITMAVLAKLWENGCIDMDKPIQHYLPYFPVKYFDGKKVDITTRQLVSHLAGIRHYDKKYIQENNKQKISESENQPKKKFEFKEYYLNKRFEKVEESLKLFQNDPLVHPPGSKYLYTSHGWTLISAIVESVSKKPFPDIMKDLFKLFGMESTYLDENQPLIYNRSRNYIKNKRGRLVNAPYVDNSYKWAGGGYLSTVRDLLKFAHIMLYSYQSKSNKEKPGYLKTDTMNKIWTPVEKTKLEWDVDGSYGMGWGVVPEKHEFGCCRQQRYYVTHTGGAVGASSVLLILPPNESCENISGKPPNGVCVSMITNLISVSLNKTALDIAKTFEDVCDK